MSREKKSDGSRSANITKRKEKGKENERGASQRRLDKRRDKKTSRSKEATARNKEGRGGRGREGSWFPRAPLKEGISGITHEDRRLFITHGANN